MLEGWKRLKQPCAQTHVQTAGTWGGGISPVLLSFCATAWLKAV